jgi:integrase
LANRRGHGEGSITQRADGRWMVRVDLGRGLNGKRRCKTAYTHTEAGAVAQLRRLGGRAIDGHLVSTSTPTVGDYLEDWFATHSDDWRPSTQRGYRGAIDRQLRPAFGPLRLEQLTPQVIQRWLTDQKQAHGARRRITLAHAILRSALTSAQRLQLISVNAAELVTVPRPQARVIEPLDVAHARVFLAAAQSHRLAALFSVALACGLRLGEATGLKWDDVDLATGELRIRQQLQVVNKRLVLQPLKTQKSRRTLALPQVCVEALRVYRTRQLEQRLKAGGDWVDEGLVFTLARRGKARRLGTALHPRNVLRLLHALLQAAKLPRMRFHDLRHSAASLLIAEGVQLAEVSMLLGHSELRITADLYTHLVKQTSAKAARHMDAVLNG